MRNWSDKECTMLGDFLIARLEEARAEVRPEIAAENRGTPVISEDAQTFDSYTQQRFRERAVKRAVENITAELAL